MCNVPHFFDTRGNSNIVDFAARCFLYKANGKQNIASTITGMKLAMLRR